MNSKRQFEPVQQFGTAEAVDTEVGIERAVQADLLGDFATRMKILSQAADDSENRVRFGAGDFDRLGSVGPWVRAWVGLGDF